MRLRFLLVGLVGLGCSNFQTTARLPRDLESRIRQEGIVRSASDLTFRYTEASGRRRTRWEDRRASIVVTPATILIHKNNKIGLEITPRTLRPVAVERDGNRLKLRAGSGQSEELWSFVPPDGDAVGWSGDLKAVVSQTKQPRSIH